MMSSALPCGTPSRMSTRTTSAICFSTIRWAAVAPTFPAPTTVTFVLHRPRILSDGAGKSKPDDRPASGSTGSQVTARSGTDSASFAGRTTRIQGPSALGQRHRADAGGLRAGRSRARPGRGRRDDAAPRGRRRFRPTSRRALERRAAPRGARRSRPAARSRRSRGRRGATIRPRRGGSRRPRPELDARVLFDFAAEDGALLVTRRSAARGAASTPCSSRRSSAVAAAVLAPALVGDAPLPPDRGADRRRRRRSCRATSPTRAQEDRSGHAPRRTSSPRSAARPSVGTRRRLDARRSGPTTTPTAR